MQPGRIGIGRDLKFCCALADKDGTGGVQVRALTGIAVLSLTVAAACQSDTAEPDALCVVPEPVDISQAEFSVGDDELSSLGDVSFLQLTFDKQEAAERRFSSLTGDPETDVLVDLQIRRIFFDLPAMLLTFDSQEERDVAICGLLEDERFADWQIAEVVPVMLRTG